ncbi:glycoside hydrolase family 3 C-terminal domain-containing protein [Flammeovirga agarivorans]|uniref:Glycoside hydrolase family 3 protein n=1 Tax=Flammeovirga agarivorans TaxID=2726742 RepID=A0A7X8XXX8_9BACT|nr:glycoside hydrolase family 3 N-terminal domain-containing protein [Flammeovirga agarivorans]NLR93500.1 glycoside hydrolase family 3 protein [Flammeovirga agarivorans]
MKHLLLVFIFFQVFSLFGQNKSVDFSFYNTNLPLEERVDILVSQMSNKEKIEQMMNDAPAISRLQVPAYNWWNEALHGVARNGKATIFPQNIALAATFDTTLARKVAEAISDEAIAKYMVAQQKGNQGKYAGITFWSPNVNIFRDPRWGRGQETFGEDPLLTSEMGVAFVQGLQGNHPTYLKTAACAKHFAVHSGPEALRHTFDVTPSPKDLNETYLPAFKQLVIEGKVEGVMGAYNAVNGVPATASIYLLDDILKKQWNFDGYITSDCGALYNISQRIHYKETYEEGAAAALLAGTNLNCGTNYHYLEKALEEGYITEELLHQRVTQLFKTRFRLGLFDGQALNPYWNISPSTIHSETHVQLSKKVAESSIVLLKNKDHILPLSKDLQTPYVTGPFANSSDMLMGSYYGISPNMVTILEGIANALPLGTSLNYRSGVLPFHDNINSKNWAPFVAGESDVTICVVGTSADMEGEEVDAIASQNTGDRVSLSLPKNQVQYISELKKHSKGPIVLIVASGSPVTLENVEEHCDAILQIWYPGEQGGNAVADILFGDVVPSGHLPITFPKNIDQLPAFDDYSMEGRTYKFMEHEPQYPFGFGLSYTSFQYQRITQSTKKLKRGETLRLSIDIKNTGELDAEDVIQVYLIPPKVTPQTPKYILKAFTKKHIPSGEIKSIQFDLHSDDFLLYNNDGKQEWYKGSYRIAIGNALPSQRSLELGAATPVVTEIILQ